MVGFRKKLLVLGGSFLLCSNTVLPIRTPLISMPLASVMSAASSAASFFISASLHDAASKGDCLPLVGCVGIKEARLLTAASITIGALLIPAFALSQTSRGIFVNAQCLVRVISSKEFVRQSSERRLELYDFITANFGDRSWPLVGAKKELRRYFERLDSARKRFKRALAVEKNKGHEWKDGLTVYVQLKKLRDHIGQLLQLISEHPEYLQQIGEYEQQQSLLEIANAQRYQAHVRYTI